MAKAQFMVGDAQLIFKNFAGAEGPYNDAGNRNFAVRLEDEQLVQDLIADGYNVKFPKEREVNNDEEDTRVPYLQVSVKYGKGPQPKIVQVINGESRVMDESEIDMLDWAQIEKADLIIRPYHYEVANRSGVKAYCKALYVTLATDEFMERYGI